MREVLGAADNEVTRMAALSFRFIDLFAGLGGFHVALRRLGGTCVFAAEWQEHLRVLYRENHGIEPIGDIAPYDSADVPEHDVLTAGFPCQPFSKAGDQLGFACTKQGQLVFKVAEIIAAKRPSFFILENVPNLLKHDKGRTMEEIRRVLEDQLGYDVRAERFSPHDFGIPQIRERVYIVGSRKPLASFQWPERTKQTTDIRAVLDTQPQDAKPLTKQVAECLDTWNDFLHRSPASVEIPYYPLWTMEWGADYGFEDETPYAAYFQRGKRALTRMKGSHGIRLGGFSGVDERFAALPSHARGHSFEFPSWKKHFIRSNRAFYADNRQWIDPWLAKVLRFPSSLQKLEWNAKGGERDIYRYVIQFRASGVRVKQPTRAPSLVAMTDTQVPIIGWERRYMTERECARLQSLHSLRALPASRPKAFAALGNAVNTDVVERVARALFAGTHPVALVAPSRPSAHLPACQPSAWVRTARIADADPVEAC